MEKIFLIGAAGFVFLSIYTRRIKEFRVDTNSNKFLVRALVWGMLPFVTVSLLRMCSFWPTLPKELPADLIFTVDIILLIFFSVLLGLFLSCPAIQKIIMRVEKWIMEIPENLPKAEGLLAYDLLGFAANGDTLIFTLRNGKVYVGALIYAEHREDIAQEEKAVKIIPWKSGFRTENNNVKYTTRYMSADDDGSADTANLELVILQREIVSYTAYDDNADKIFGHSQTG